MKKEKATCAHCGYPLDTGEHSAECRQQKNRERVSEQSENEINRIVQESLPEDLRNNIIRVLTANLQKEPTVSLMSEDDHTALVQRVGEIDYTHKEGVAKAFLSAVDLLIELHVEHALEYEDLEALESMESQGFTPINERVSYSLGGGRLHLHLAQSHERKEQIEDMYRDALNKVVGVVKVDPDIKEIGGWSWLNATKKYGDMKERLGFTISDISPEELAMHEHSDDRPRKNALMTREVFLSLYDTGA